MPGIGHMNIISVYVFLFLGKDCVTFAVIAWNNVTAG